MFDPIRFLAGGGAFFHGLQQMCWLCAIPCAFFIERGRFWWPLAALCGLFVVPIVPFYFTFQAISSLFGFVFWQRVMTRATLDEAGIHCIAPERTFSLAWREIESISRVKARSFPQTPIRFHDATAFEFVMRNGEREWADELDEENLRRLAKINDVPMQMGAPH